MSDTPEAQPPIKPVTPTVETVVKIGAALTDQKNIPPPPPRIAADIQIEDALAQRDIAKAKQALIKEVEKTHGAVDTSETGKPNP